jgi:hypothetical protein
MDLDCLLLTAIHLSVPDTLLISTTCTYIYKNIWKLKLQYHYPNKKYFDFWTGPQNYLIHSKGLFALAINFYDVKYVNKYIYEYDPMLQYVLNMIDDTNRSHDINIPNLVEFNISDQFILVKNDSDLEPKILGQYETNKNAIKVIKKDKLKKYIGIDNFTYVIIDLEYTTPHFWKLKNKKIKYKKRNPGTYY